MKRLTSWVLPVVCLALFLTVIAPISPVTVSANGEPTYIQFIIDSSLSMRKVVAPKQSRLDVAKAALEEVIQALPSGSDIQIALRVYGAGLMPDEPCKDSVLVQPFGTVETGRQRILEFVRGLRPKGMTPIGYSLQQAGKDFSTAGARNVIVLLTDGAESCRVDPCLISQQLQAQGIMVEPYVIGFDMTPDEEALVACIGKYYSANDLDSLKRALSNIMAEAVAPTQIGVTTLAQGKNVTERAVIEILDSGGRVIQAKRGSSNLKELVFSLSSGVYTARATLEVGPELITAEKQNIQLTEGQVIQATLDFGDLAGKVSITASAGASDVSAGVTIEVLDRGAIVGTSWQGIPPTTILPAGTYTFRVSLRDNPAISRTITSWIPPYKTTDLVVDLGELPAILNVKARFMDQDITPQTTLAVSRQGRLESSFPLGNSLFTLEGDSGSVDLTVRFMGDVPIEKNVNVVLKPGEESTVVVDFTDLLGVVNVTVKAGERDVTASSAVKADGTARLDLPLVGQYLKAILPAGAYVLEATNPEALDSSLVELLVKAGEVQHCVIALKLPGMITVLPYFGSKPAPLEDFEGHVWNGDKYVVQLAPVRGGLSRSVAPGSYRVTATYMMEPQQTREDLNVVVTSEKTTEVKLSFDGYGTLMGKITSGDALYNPGWVHVFDEAGQYVNDLNRVSDGIYANSFAEGIYDVLVILDSSDHTEVWFRGIKVDPLTNAEHEFAVAGVGELRLVISSDGRPYRPGWLTVHSKQGQAVGDLYEIEDGVFGNEFVAGVYDVQLIPETGAMEEVWVTDLEVIGSVQNVYEYAFGGVGELLLKVFAAGRPYRPGWVEVHDKNGELVTDFWEEQNGTFLTELSAGIYDVLLIPETDGMEGQWLRNVSIQGGKRAVYEFSFPGIGELELRVMVDGRPLRPGWLIVYNKEGNEVGDLWEKGDGVYFGELPEGVYDAVAIFEDDSEAWLYDIRVVANQKQTGVIHGTRE